MGTMFFNLINTITSGDTVVLEVVKAAEECMPTVKNAGTNCNDVWITVVICLTLILLALIVKRIICKLNNKNEESHSGSGNANGKKRECSSGSGSANGEKGGCSSESVESNKWMSENVLKYTEKLLDYLKCQTIRYGEKGDFKGYKPIDSPESRMYCDMLACMIEKQGLDKGEVAGIRNALKLVDNKLEESGEKIDNEN